MHQEAKDDDDDDDDLVGVQLDSLQDDDLARDHHILIQERCK